LKEIANELASLGINRAMVVHELKGNPSRATFYKLIDGKLVERDYKVRIKGIALARELNRGRSVFTAESRLRIINKCTSDFGEQLYTMLSLFFNFNKERELPRIPDLKGIALYFSDDPGGNITLDFQQIETKEMIGPRITISDVHLGKKGEAIRSLMGILGIGKRQKS